MARDICLRCGKALKKDDFYICKNCLLKISSEAFEVRTYIECYLPLPYKYEEESLFKARLISRAAAAEILKKLVTTDNDCTEILMKYIGEQCDFLKETEEPNDIYEFETCIAVAEDIVNYLKIL